MPSVGANYQRVHCSMVGAVLFDLFKTLVTEAHVHPTRASSPGARLGLALEAFRRAWRVRRPRIVLGQSSFVDAPADVCPALTGGVDLALDVHA